MEKSAINPRRTKYYPSQENKSYLTLEVKMTQSKEYRTWYWMKTVCYNEKSPGFKNYGLKGFKMSESWLQSYENFLEDMGYCPIECTGIELIDKNKGFSKENCKWVGHHNRKRIYKPKKEYKKRLKKFKNPKSINIRLEKDHYDYIVRQAIEKSRQEGKRISTTEIIVDALENQFPYSKQKTLF
jgi:hypothetical protein